MNEPTTVALHLGFSRSEGSSDLALAVQESDTVGKVFDEGDSWEEWGEPSTDSPNGHLVVVVSGDTIESAMNGAQALGHRFGKVVSDDAYRCTWVVTDVNDWSIVLAIGTVADRFS